MRTALQFSAVHLLITYVLLEYLFFGEEMTFLFAEQLLKNLQGLVMSVLFFIEFRRSFFEISLFIRKDARLIMKE